MEEELVSFIKKDELSVLKVFYTSDQVLQFKRDRLYTNEDLIGKGDAFLLVPRIN